MEKEQLFIKMVMQNWESYIKRADDLFDSLSEDQLSKEISPGRNTGIYLLGHLVSVQDRILPVLGLGEPLYPQLEKPFLSNPDKSGFDFPPVAELRKDWETVNKKLSAGFNAMTEEGWFQRHNSVTEQDFVKEPHRNKLNIIINRTGHLAYHLGQLALLKKAKA